MLRRVLVSCVLVGLSVSLQTALCGDHSRFTRFVVAALPERAVGDFDGDGLMDIANISRHGTEPGDVSVTLSGSHDALRLDTPVASLIEGDVDNDGDLDLLATTASGDVLIWVNDGHGQFTLRPQSSTRSLSGQSALQSHDTESIAAATTSVPVLTSRAYTWRAVVARAIRPPTGTRPSTLNAALLPPLRAPPSVLL